MSGTQKHLVRGRAPSHVQWHVNWHLYGLALGLVAASAGCLGGHSTRETPGTGGRGPGREAPGEGGRAPDCTVSSDTALGADEGSSPVIAFGAGHYAAAWTERGTGLHVAAFDAAGSQAGTTVIPGDHPTEAAITALEGGGFLVVWREAGKVRGVRTDGDGGRAGTPFTLATTAGGDARPSTAAAAGGAAIAWADASGVTAGSLSGDRVGGQVTVAGASDPSLATAEGGLGLTFVTGNKVGFARLAVPVHGISPVTFRDAAGRANVPRASPASDGGFFVAWEDGRGGDGNEAVYLTHVDRDGKPSAEVAVTEGSSADYPDVVTLGDHAAVVYYQFRDGPPAVYLSLVGPDLRKADGEVRISGKGARFPRAAAGDGGLGVVYAQTGGPARLALVTCR